MTTNSLDRYTGTLTDGTAWSVVAKVLHPASESSMWEFVPEFAHDDVIVALNWLDEPARYRSGLGDALPGELRMPHVHAIDERPSRITIWMEDVVDTQSWDDARYRRTAHALGRLGGRWRDDSGATHFALPRREIETLFYGKVSHFDLPMQVDDEFWRRPWVAAVADASHRRDLFELAERMPAILAGLATLPRGVCHGDAAPDNFLEPGDGSIVAIDWSYANVDTLGSDLGQVLAGRYESGTGSIDAIEAHAAAIMQGFREGLISEGADIPVASIEHAWAAHLATRAVFSALTLPRRPDLDDDAFIDLMQRRAALARFGLDLALRVSAR